MSDWSGLLWCRTRSGRTIDVLPRKGTPMGWIVAAVVVVVLVALVWWSSRHVRGPRGNVGG